MLDAQSLERLTSICLRTPKGKGKGKEQKKTKFWISWDSLERLEVGVFESDLGVSLFLLMIL